VRSLGQRILWKSLWGACGRAALQRRENARKNGASAPARIFVMQSNGGITALNTAAREPVRTVLSGPAGGVVGAAATARASGFDRIIAFDMGGTSTDVSLVDGAITTATMLRSLVFPSASPCSIFTRSAPVEVRLPASMPLAFSESARIRRSRSGPICYGRGTQPTVTDANLLLGRLQPTRFLGGDFTLDLERTRRLTQEWLHKQPAKLTLNQLPLESSASSTPPWKKQSAWSRSSAAAIPPLRARRLRRSGRLARLRLAEALSIPQVIVPALPGAFPRSESSPAMSSRNIRARFCGASPANCHAEIESRIRGTQTKRSERFSPGGMQGKPHFIGSVDVRYHGQGYELNIPLTKICYATLNKNTAAATVIPIPTEKSS